MPVLTVYPRGCTGGFAPSTTKAPSLRGDVAGWSSSAARRNARFTMSVDPRKLPPGGVALSLTVRDVPESPEAWGRLRTALLNRLRRTGLDRYHWVVEWQRRRAPHLHLSVWLVGLDPAQAGAVSVRHWLDLAAAYRPRASGQFASPIWGFDGWSRYCAKHVSRGAGHAQRSPEYRPESWKRSGRMWGKGGDWPTAETRLELDTRSFHRLRRWLHRWAVDQARREVATLPACTKRRAVAEKRARYLVHRLRNVAPERSAVLGFGEWVTAPVLARMLDVLVDQGAELRADEQAAEEVES